jgi:hypothetical protein
MIPHAAPKIINRFFPYFLESLAKTRDMIDMLKVPNAKTNPIKALSDVSDETNLCSTGAIRLPEKTTLIDIKKTIRYSFLMF